MLCVLGLNGEPYAQHRVKLQFQLDYYINPSAEVALHTITLETDSNGEIVLGALPNVL